jgi:hypothetical protein
MASLPFTSELYSRAASGLDKYINPDSLVNTIQVAVNAYMPAVYAMGFLLLTAGTMREFLSPETKRFFGTLLRAILLVACMSSAPTLIGWLGNAADALAQMPAGVSFSINGTSYSLTGAQSPSLTQLESALQSKVQGGGNANGPGISQSSSGPFDFLGSAGTAVKSLLSNAEHLAWEILFAIFLLWLLLCKVVVILMLFIQKVVVIGFNLYTPIAIGEYAHRSLKSKAVSFFLTFVGVLMWPVGWSLVNAVTMGVLKSVPTPENQNFVTLLVAIVAAIPVFLWILIGYVVAPIYAQKVVTRGGAAVQGFVGTMMSVVGQSSAAVIGSALGAPAVALGLDKDKADRGAVDRSGRSPGAASGVKPGKVFAESMSGGDAGMGNSDQESPAPVVRRRGLGGVLGIGAAAIGTAAVVAKPVAVVMAAGVPVARRFGSASQFIGHGTAEGAGETSGMEFRAIRLINDGSGRRLRPSGNQGNRSSLQARGYIDRE